MSLARATAGAAGLTAGLGLLGILGPTFSGAALFLLPLPALAVGQIGGIAAAIAVAVSTSAIATVVIDPEVASLYLAFAGLPAVVAIWSLSRGWRIDSVIGTVLLVALVGSAAALLAFRTELGALQDSLAQAWKESFAQALDVYRRLGMSEEQLTDLELQRENLQQGSLALLPAVLVLSSGVMWLVDLRLARRWAPWPQLFNLKGWQAPSWLIWVLIGTGFALFIPHPIVSAVALNLFAVLLGCYFCQGLAIVSFYLQRFGLPTGLRVASYLLIAFQYVIAGIVLMLGVFDLWGDFRRLSVGATDAQSHADSE
jgi:uncharacterized protein YybS (DUF2232 family)